MISRENQKQIQNHLLNNKILILKAPSFTGRTELILNAIPEKSEAVIFDFSNKKELDLFKEFNADEFHKIIGTKEFVVFKEAQFLRNLQEIIEYILFEETNLNLICICSYDPPIDDVLHEALIQNNLIIQSQAPTFNELAKYQGIIPFEKSLEERLIFGNYPQTIDNADNSSEILQKITTHISNYSFSKNERINKKDKLKKLLQYVSFNIGKSLSYNQIATKSDLDNETVERYISMLEKAFILIKIPVFSNENRYELSKTHSFYFYDNGIRNAFIQNFNALELRNDVKELWKNWLISEKVKKNSQKEDSQAFYFWITHTKQQVDFLIQNKNDLRGFQIVWDKSDKTKIPNLFKSYYPKALTYTINRSSYWSFLMKD